MTDRVPLAIATVVAQLRALGVRDGGVLVVHTAFSATGPIEGGPLGLIEALQHALGAGGTLVMPTMTDGASRFDPRSTPTCDMGITAELFWRRPGVLRSDHPGASFAASGPRAAEICLPQPLSPPHGVDSPIGRVPALGGQVLLLGVTHSENTLLHVAEAIANVPYSVSHPCVVEQDGVLTTQLIAETDHCCAAFRKLDAWLGERGQQREGVVGHAQARLCEARDVIDAAVEHLRREPLVFLCERGSGCDECDAAHASVSAWRCVV